MHPQLPLAEKFWSKVAIAGPDECWLWTASVHGNGYGQIFATPERDMNMNAHVVSWFLHTGTWPDKGIFICHNCPGGDNPLCVNPSHLFCGTQLDNMQDSARKGRSGPANHPERMARGKRNGTYTHPERLARGQRNGTHTHPETVMRGEKHPKCKMTDAQTAEAFTLQHTQGWPLGQLAKRYGIATSTMHHRLKAHKKQLEL
jgi:hypothetical protein